MGRRALPKIDPALDLSTVLGSLDDTPPPFDATAVFGRAAPLELEIGSGKGLFLATAAAAHPERNFLGTEVDRKYAKFVAARCAKRGLSNVRVVQGDALRLLAEWVPDRSLAAVHVYFPDPWWKKRHHKRRVFRPSFVRDIERALVDGGRLHFWTDVEDYFHAALELIAAETKLVGPMSVAERSAEHDLDYRTHFERRTRLSGQSVYRSEFRKHSL
ncbi:MAG: tRNA (guanosine(46)-N7)-methyltransferase TrmB [Pirellulales bacterium]